jgi:hypothetical protein
LTSAISTKEDAANKSTDIALGSSDVLFPTQNAVKNYVDGLMSTSALTYLPLSGGTLTGTLNANDANFNNLITTTNRDAFKMQQEEAFISGFNNAGTVRSGFLQFNSVANYVRLAAENTNQLQLASGGNVALTLDADQKANFSSTVTASSFIKSGGNGSNLLLDDGSTLALSFLATSANYLPLTGGTLTGTLIATDATFTGYAQLNNELRLADATGTIKWQLTPTGDDLSFTQTGVASDQFMVKAGGNISAKGNANLAGQLTTGAVTYPNTDGTAGQLLATNGSGTASWTTVAIKEIADEFAASTLQTDFTLTQAPSVNSKVKMFVNGIRISNSAYTVIGTTLTYTPASNGAYALTAGDRIQFDYYY